MPPLRQRLSRFGGQNTCDASTFTLKPAERGSRSVVSFSKCDVALKKSRRGGNSDTNDRSNVRRFEALDNDAKEFSPKLACGATNISRLFFVRLSKRAITLLDP